MRFRHEAKFITICLGKIQSGGLVSLKVQPFLLFILLLEKGFRTLGRVSLRCTRTRVRRADSSCRIKAKA